MFCRSGALGSKLDNYNPGLLLLASPDGKAWEVLSTDLDRNLEFASWAQGTWIVGGDKGTLITSIDGRRWYLQETQTKQILQSSAFGNGRFVAVGTASDGLVSLDSVSWLKIKI